eukprot:s1217_g12.t3
MSSTWAAIGAILCGNLAGVFSQFEIIGGKSAQILSLEQWMALILATIAMWVYNIQDEVDNRGESAATESLCKDGPNTPRNVSGSEGLPPLDTRASAFFSVSKPNLRLIPVLGVACAARYSGKKYPTWPLPLMHLLFESKKFFPMLGLSFWVRMCSVFLPGPSPDTLEPWKLGTCCWVAKLA